jgi:hypothetical protein
LSISNAFDIPNSYATNKSIFGGTFSFTKNQMDAKKLRKIEIKPLSINKAWKGRRFKTKEHVNYCKAIDISVVSSFNCFIVGYSGQVSPAVLF